mgnify:CR=1 FL=1
MGIPKKIDLGTHIVEHGVLCTHVQAFNVNILLIILSFAPKFKQLEHCDRKYIWSPCSNKKTQKSTTFHIITNTKLVPSSSRYLSIRKYMLIYMINYLFSIKAHH